MEQVDCPVIRCSVYVYISKHVPPRTLRHTLKMARSHQDNRSCASTLRQLRQPSLTRASRSRTIVRNTSSPYVTYCSLKHQLELVSREERCLPKYSIKEQAQKLMVKRFTSADLFTLLTALRVQITRLTRHLILYPLRLLPLNKGHEDRRNACEGHVSDLFSDSTRLK